MENLLARKTPELIEKVLSYQNLELVERFKSKLGLDDDMARQVFVDLKQFLYICGTRPGIASPTDKIDAAWHEFVLYTMDYASFCDEMFGRFIHHVPPKYLEDNFSSKGKVWRTYQIALQLFNDLSPNWEVPENRRPKYNADGSNVMLFESDPCSSCGCAAACSGCTDG